MKLREGSARERIHPDRIDEMRRYLARAEEIACEDLLVRGDIRGDANDGEFVESPLHPSDGLVAITAPGDHLREK
jgi:hypothetical protein